MLTRDRISDFDDEAPNTMPGQYAEPSGSWSAVSVAGKLDQDSVDPQTHKLLNQGNTTGVCGLGQARASHQAAA